MKSLLLARRFMTKAYCARQSIPVDGLNVSQYLTGLKQKELGRKLTDAEANAEAEEWLKALKETREQLTNGDSGYIASKAFRPENLSALDPFNILEHAEEVERERSRFRPTTEQIAEKEKFQGEPIPERFDDTVNYLVNTIMRHGKKGMAQKMMSQALYLVQLKTRQDPIKQLKEVLDRMAPLVKLKTFSDGGARKELIPSPMTETQRIRQAWMWILDASKRRPSKDFSVRLSEEIISAIKGNSPGFEKKVQQHKLAIVNRSYITLVTRKRRGRGSQK